MYMHKRMAKKKARMVSSNIACCSSVNFRFAILVMTQAGMALLLLFFGVGIFEGLELSV
jgi:hypothetical protein